MKVSVVATVFNEEETIGPLLDSLLEQTKTPDEIVVVDGGSSDATENIIASYQMKSDKIKLFVEPGSVAHGRNKAIMEAENEIVAQIDAGCKAHKDWLEKITAPFKDKSVGLVAGFYIMTGDTPFQKAVSVYHGVHPRRFDPRNFMPSGRSMAFTKETWEKAGRYSENLDRCGEDSLFNYNAMKAGVKIVREKSALVDWEVPKTYRESLKKFYGYAKGDAQAAIWWHPAQKMSTHNIKIVGIFARYIVGALLMVWSIFVPVLLPVAAILFIFYILNSIWKSQDVVHEMRAKLWIPFIQFGSDITVMAGFFNGFTLRKLRR